MKKVFLTILAVGGLMFTACEKEDGIGQGDLDRLHASYGSQISELQNQLDNANLSIDDLNGIIADANAEIASLDSNIQEQADEIAGLREVIELANERISGLEAENTELSEALAAANEIIDNLNSNPITVTEFVTVVETVVETVEVVRDSEADLSEYTNTIAAQQETIAEFNALLAAANERIAELELVVPEDGASQADLDALQASLDTANALADTYFTEIADQSEAYRITEEELRAIIATLEAKISTLEGVIDSATTTETSVSSSTFEWDETKLGAHSVLSDGDALDVINVITTTTTTETINANGDVIDTEESSVSTYEYVENNAPEADVTDEIISSVSTSQSGGVETLTTAGTFSEWISNGDGTESRSKTDVYTTSAVIETTVTTYSVQVNGVEDTPALVAPASTSVDEEITAASTREDVVTETQDEAPAFDAKDLDQDNDVDFDDASAAGYTAVSNAAQFPLSGFFGVATDGTNEIFNEGFLTSAEALSAAQAAALSHYNAN